MRKRNLLQLRDLSNLYLLQYNRVLLCPLNKEQYQNLVQEILNSKKIEFKEWETNTPYFDGCLPIEEMAKRGEDVLRFGPSSQLA